MSRFSDSDSWMLCPTNPILPQKYLRTTYPDLKVDRDYSANLIHYKMDDKVIYTVNFLQNSTPALYKAIEEAILKYINDRDAAKEILIVPADAISKGNTM